MPGLNHSFLPQENFPLNYGSQKIFNHDLSSYLMLKVARDDNVLADIVDAVIEYGIAEAATRKEKESTGGFEVLPQR